MRTLIVMTYVVGALLVLGAMVFTWRTRKKRLKTNVKKPPKGHIKTDEIFIDPTTGIKQQVWFNPRTGERFYETIDH
ncbi:hypothetical protein N007_21310 [Alicyclobacillus acidoterrestris ATCC 49025]|nr:hypothetical protein N007_21310 [Alicyclobacillus acidoterrestris ATCC 49025]